MSYLGLLGHAATGYNEAARQDRLIQIQNQESERDRQVGLIQLLVNNPNVPDEYKGPLIQHGMDVIHTPLGKKLPSFDKVMQSLPAVQRPLTTPQVQAPAIQLPSAPPDIGFTPRNSNAVSLGGPLTSSGIQPSPLGGPSSAALPGSSIQKATGSPSVPANLPSPIQASTAPPTLPATPVAMPTPPPIAEAGQFHLLTPQEQVQRQMATAVTHANVLMANGVPRQQALVAAGLVPKPELHNIPWGGKAINPYTGEEVEGGVKPVGQPIKFVDDNKEQHLMQRFSDGTMKEIQADGMKPMPPASMLPTESSTSSRYDAETGTTTTTRRTQKVLPTNTVRKTFDRPATTTALQAPGSKSNVAKMAEQWANYGVVPNAKDKRQVSQYMNDNNMQPMVKLPASEGAKLSTAFTDAQDSENRLATMREDIKQIDNNPDNAGSYDMDLLSQHIAMTFGSVRGVRTSQQLIEHHLKARSLPESLAVVADRVLRGDQLSPEQRANFLHLAETRAGQARQKYDNLRQNLSDRYGEKAQGITAPSAQSGPKVGDVEDGYKFKGGNAADPNNWEKVSQ